MGAPRQRKNTAPTQGSPQGAPHPAEVTRRQGRDLPRRPRQGGHDTPPESSNPARAPHLRAMPSFGCGGPYGALQARRPLTRKEPRKNAPSQETAAPPRPMDGHAPAMRGGARKGRFGSSSFGSLPPCFFFPPGILAQGLRRRGRRCLGLDGMRGRAARAAARLAFQSEAPARSPRPNMGKQAAQAAEAKGVGPRRRWKRSSAAGRSTTRCTCTGTPRRSPRTRSRSPRRLASARAPRRST